MESRMKASPVPVPPPSPRGAKTPWRGGRLPQSEVERRIEALLEIAREEFAARGFGGTNLDRLVERSGVSKTTILRRFGSKEGLFRTLIDRTMVAIHARLNAVEFDMASPHRTVMRFIDAYTEAAIGNPLGHMLLGIAILERNAFPHLSNMILQHAEEGLRPIGDFIARLMDEGVLQRADPMEVALDLQGLMTQGFRVFVEDPGFLARPDRSRAIATRFLKGWS